ncbi:MAG: hypothetical protein CBE13_003045 [Candidatus Pelagibacter sp. TMED253]|nr:MAG: hypothetical protein CBE13_003045 [Candidatus Pelagibacter sp. TMED253]|tara:strand:+ start:1957 stop:3282 length:1326 start_codon:yes stop_codon:yes gene_type:complete
MKRLLLIIFIIILTQCSFDNKTGIWDNTIQVSVKNDKRFKDFDTLYTEEKSFRKIISPDKSLKISFDPIKTVLKWPDEFYKNSNNLDNFSYKNLNEIIFKSKKLSKYKIKDKLLFDGENIIAVDSKGSIFLYSIENRKISFKYNFYKKKYKKLEKNLNIIVEKNIAYVSDDIGYLYAINYKDKRLLWAKYYKIPFRSNLKILENKIILADQNNTLYVINKFNGEKLKLFPTEEVVLKNDFSNSIALNNESLFYLNTYGSLYSVNKNNLNIDWFLSLNKSLELSPGNLFYSNPIVIYKDKIIVSTDPTLYVLDSNSGFTLFQKSITSIVSPIISDKYLFIITKDNLLVCIDLISGNILYSSDVNQEIANFLKTKKKSISIKSLSIVNNSLSIFLNNSYIVNFNKNGKVKNIKKLRVKLGTFPIFISNSILYLNKKNKLIILN